MEEEYIRTVMDCMEEGQLIWFAESVITESQYEHWYDYLLNDCNVSIFKPATVVYYSNSGVSVVFYLLCVGLLGWKMYRKTERRYFPFIILMFLLETVNIVAKNVYQKFGLPIIDGNEMDRGRWVRGWYKDYEISTKILLEEILLGANLAQEILLLAVNFISILIMYGKTFWYIYPLALLVYAPLQCGYLYFRWFEGEDLGAFLGIYPFFPPLFALFTWLSCISLKNFATYTLFPILRDERRNRRFLKMMATTSSIAILSCIEVYPEALVTVIYVATFKIVQYHLTTISGWFGEPWYAEIFSSIIYCQQVLILVFEISKYFSGFKMLYLIRFLTEEERLFSKETRKESTYPLIDTDRSKRQSPDPSRPHSSSQ